MSRDSSLRFVRDAQGSPQGVILDEALWQQVRPHVLAALDRLYPVETTMPEPLADLALLEKYWDLRYDLPTDVACELCGQSSPDWKADEPRKFMLRAANMGGLLSFQCMACKARISKLHFKDKVRVTCTPHQERRD